MDKVKMDLFDQAVEQYNLRPRWRDGLFLTTDEERDANEQKMYREAKARYAFMLSSPKSKGSAGYLRWALEASLRTKPRKMVHRQALNGRLR